MKRSIKKFFSILCVVFLVVSIFPLAALASLQDDPAQPAAGEPSPEEIVVEASGLSEGEPGELDEPDEPQAQTEEAAEVFTVEFIYRNAQGVDTVIGAVQEVEAGAAATEPDAAAIMAMENELQKPFKNWACPAGDYTNVQANLRVRAVFTSGPLLRAPAPENLFVIDGAGTITKFYYNSSDPIKNLEIPGTINGKTVTGIGYNVFSGCGLESVVIPETVTNIGTMAFYSNALLRTVTFAGNSQLTTLGTSIFYQCTSLNNVTIPGGVTKITNSMFRDCSSLSNITLPDGITEIDNSAFSRTALVSFVAPASLTTIGEAALKNTSTLTSVTLPEGLISIGGDCFYGTSLSEISIPSTVQSIGTDAFYRLTAKEESFVINLPHHYPDAISGKPWGSVSQYIYWKSDVVSCFDITAAGVLCGLKPPGHDAGQCEHTSWHQEGNGDIVIPAKIGETVVTSLLPGAFESNQNVRSVTFEAGCAITEISARAFYNCKKLSSITLPNTITRIGESAFQATEKLFSIQLPDNLETIAKRAFYTSRIRSISIPVSVNTVAEEAFYFAYSLETATFVGYNPALTIGTDAFPAHSVITDIYLLDYPYVAPGSPAGQPWSAQYAAVHWKDFIYPPEIIVTSDGWHFNRVEGKLVKYAGPTGAGVDVTVPYSIPNPNPGPGQPDNYTVTQQLPNSLLMNKTFRNVIYSEGYTTVPLNFMHSSVAASVTLPSTLTSISSTAAFMDATIGTLYLPDSLSDIGISAFMDAKIETLGNFLPSSIEIIQKDAFNNFPLNIEDWVIPDTVTTIKDGAFDKCGLSGVITIPGSMTSIGYNAFANNPGITAFYVDAYRNDVPSAMKSTQPWVGVADSNIPVYYKGELPSAIHESVTETALALTPLSRVDFTTALETDSKGNPVTYFSGVWVAKGDLGAFPASGAQQIFNYTTDGANVFNMTLSVALEPGTYTFFVSTAMMTTGGGTQPDPTQYVPYTITVDKTLSLPVAAYDFGIFPQEAPGMSQASALTKANASSADPCSNDAATLGVSAADLAAIQALATYGETANITVNGTYSGTYTYAGALKDPFGPTHAYSVDGSANITVTVVSGYTVSFATGTNGAFNGTAETQINHLDLASGATFPTAPAVLADSGYTFAGWKNMNDSVVYQTSGLPATVTGTVLYVAQYTPVYTLSFSANGGNQSTVPASQQINGGALATQPATVPAYTGHTFAGWFKEAACQNAWNFAVDRMPAANMTLYAKWTADPAPPTPTPTPLYYTLSFSLNGAQGTTPGSQRLRAGETTRAVGVPTRTGYYFSGWNTSPAGDGTFWAPGVNVMPARNVTLYAQWAREQTGDGTTITPPVTPPTTPPDGTTGGGTGTPVNTPETPISPVENSSVPVFYIGDTAIPLMGPSGSSWALINLICSILGLVAAVIAVVSHLTRKKDDRNAGKLDARGLPMYTAKEAKALKALEEKNRKRSFRTKLVAGIISVAGIVVFLLTENMRNPMVLIDRYTLLHVVLLVLLGGSLLVGKRKKLKSEDEDNTGSRSCVYA